MGEFRPSPKQEEALDISRSVSVTASAGTGKTFILQKRFVELLLAGIEPKNILCLTYTDKAAAEMREKIEKELREQAEETGNETLKGYCDVIHQCTISTFHGFCSGILHEFPLEADVPMGYAVMDSLDKHDLINHTVDEVLERPPDELRDRVTCLLQYITETRTIAKAVITFYSRWDRCSSWFDRLDADEESVWKEWEAWKKDLAESTLADLLEDDIYAAALEELARLFKETSNAGKAYHAYMTARNGKKGDIFETLEALAKLESSLYKNKKGYSESNKKYITSTASRLKNFVSASRPMPLNDTRVRLMLDVMKAFGAVTRHVVETVRKKKEEGGYLDFDDLVTDVHRMLATNPHVCDELKRRYHVLLVDEVQDNDSALTDIVRILADDFSRNRKLFVVGDMKQSIYGFRGAAPEQAAELINGFGHPPVELDMNFRTVRHLIDIINTVFTCHYAPGKEKGISYSGVGAKRDEDIGSFTLVRPQTAKEGETAPSEAGLLASWIRKVVDDQSLDVYDRTEVAEPDGTRHPVGMRKATYRDFAILIRAKKLAVELGTEFKRYGIPYHVHSGKDIYHEQEVYDLLNVVRASVFQEDGIALYGALISPYFGISDAEIATALSPVVPESFMETFGTSNPSLRTRLKALGGPKIQAALETMDGFTRAAATLPVSALLHRIVRDTGVLTIYGAIPDGFDRIGNLRKFLEIAELQTRTRGIGITDFIRLIETCIEEKVEDELGATETDSDSEDRVGILTTHVSKGLEYNVVVLYHAGKTTTGHNDKVYCDPVYHCGFASLKHPAYSYNLFGFIGELIRQKNEPLTIAEEKRLFYVGMTRARDHLAITSGAEPEKNSPMNWFAEAADPAGLADEVVSAVFDNVPETNTEETVMPDDWTAGITIPPVPEDTPHDEWALQRGIGIHEIFEGKDFEETCLKYGFMDSDTKKEKTAIRESLDFFRQDSRLQHITKERHEYPLFTKNGEKRIVDMFVRYEDGTCCIFDFKTGDPASLKPELREKYRNQLTEYAEMLKSIYRMKTEIPAWLYFVDRKVFIKAEDI